MNYQILKDLQKLTHSSILYDILAINLPNDLKFWI